MVGNLYDLNDIKQISIVSATFEILVFLIDCQPQKIVKTVTIKKIIIVFFIFKKILQNSNYFAQLQNMETSQFGHILCYFFILINMLPNFLLSCKHLFFARRGSQFSAIILKKIFKKCRNPLPLEFTDVCLRIKQELVFSFYRNGTQLKIVITSIKIIKFYFIFGNHPNLLHKWCVFVYFFLEYFLRSS